MFGVSTLGCPGMPVDEVIALLRRHGVDGIELRCAPDEPFHIGVSKAARQVLRRRLEDAGLTVISLATYVRLTEGAADLPLHLELAFDLGAPAIRLMPGGDGNPARHLPAAASALARAVTHADGSGVRLLVETHDAFLRGRDLAALLAAAPGAGAVWDALHPWRAGETPAETAAALLPYLGEVQIKDVATPDRLTPLVPGTGAVPIREILRLAPGFPVVLEHEARWYPDAAPIAESIDGALRLL